MEKIRVMVVDDQMIIRQGAKLILMEDTRMELCGEASTGADFLAKMSRCNPDVVLMDIAMPEMDGLEATNKVLPVYPELKVIAFSSLGNEEMLVKMIEAGARGFVTKSADKEELTEAIVKVHGGMNYYSSELLPAMARQLSNFTAEQEAKALLEPLSKRELQVMQLICEGYTDKEIADKLSISHRTIGGHRTKILAKTGCTNSVGLIFFAMKNKLLRI